MSNNGLQLEGEAKGCWEALAGPGNQHTENAFNRYLQVNGGKRKVLHCAVKETRARELTEFKLPEGVGVHDCLRAGLDGRLPQALQNWDYTPKIRAVAQLPYMQMLPPEHASLVRVPWFQTPSPCKWMWSSGQHLRYHHQLWRDIRPSTLQGVQTTLVMALPQFGHYLSPHIQTDKMFLFLAALARGYCPVQLFPGKYLYPGANLGEFGNAPAPIFSDILPATGGFAYPVVELEPDPWRMLTYYDRSDCYYGYPFLAVKDSQEDFELNNWEHGAMVLPNGNRVRARSSKSYVYATGDPKLNEELKLGYEEFKAATCMMRATVTHDGLPFQLPVEMQPLVYAIILTHWTMHLDRPGELTSYTIETEHAAIRGYNFFQKKPKFYDNFMRLVHEIAKNPDFKTYPLSTHLTNSWLGGNACVSNIPSKSEQRYGHMPMRSYYRQQLDWQMGLLNLLNDVKFRSKTDRSGTVSITGQDLEQALNFEGLVFHQMNSSLRFDSNLFQRPLRKLSCWPDLHPGWVSLDEESRAEDLPQF